MEIINQIELPTTLSCAQKLTKPEMDIIIIQWTFKNRTEYKETIIRMEFLNIESMKTSVYKTNELNGWSYIKSPLRFSDSSNFKNHDKFCFIWSILVKLHPISDPRNGHSPTVSNYRQFFIELNIEGFGFSNGFRRSDNHKYEKLKNFTNNIFELYIYQNQNIWRNKLLPIEASKNNSDEIVNLLIYKNHYVLIKKLNVCLGKQHCLYICRWCLNAYTNQDVLINHMQNYGQQEKSSIRLNTESHLHWKKHIHKNVLYFRTIADFEADNEIGNSNIGNKTTNIHKQNPVCNSYYIVSECTYNLESGHLNLLRIQKSRLVCR